MATDNVTPIGLHAALPSQEEIEARVVADKAARCFNTFADAKDRVAQQRTTSPVQLSTQQESALCEIRRQLNQAYTLVSAARTVLMNAEDADATAVPQQLLDMAEDVLSEHEWINRMDQLLPREEVSHG